MEKNMVNIHSMKKNEIDAVSDLFNKLAYNQMNRDVYYPYNPEFLLYADMTDYFRNCFNNRYCYVFVSEYRNKIIGFMELWLRKKDFFFSYEDYAYILHGFVDREVPININPLFIPVKLFQMCENKSRELEYKYLGGDIFAFNDQMKALMKLYKVQPYRTRYMKKIAED